MIVLYFRICARARRDYLRVSDYLIDLIRKDLDARRITLEKEIT